MRRNGQPLCPLLPSQIGTLVLVESRADGKGLASSTFNTLTAANVLGQPIAALVARQNMSAAAEAAAKLQGVTKVSTACSLGSQLEEPLIALVPPGAQHTKLHQAPRISQRAQAHTDISTQSTPRPPGARA